MADLHLDPKKTALVLIDLQNAIVGMNTVPHAAAQVVENSKKLADAFRVHGAPVVYVRVDLNDFMKLPVDQPPDLGDKPLPAAASEITPSAGFQHGDILVTKRHWGAFAGTDLEQQLKSRGIDTVVLTGISTNAGVESTARQGTGLGLPLCSSKMPAPARTLSITASPLKISFRVSPASAPPMRFWPPLPKGLQRIQRPRPIGLEDHDRRGARLFS